jgi:hypothetical protein
VKFDDSFCVYGVLTVHLLHRKLVFLFNDRRERAEAEVWVAMLSFRLPFSRCSSSRTLRSWPAFFNSLQQIVISNGAPLSLILSFSLLPSQKWEISSRQKH